MAICECHFLIDLSSRPNYTRVSNSSRVYSKTTLFSTQPRLNSLFILLQMSNVFGVFLGGRSLAREENLTRGSAPRSAVLRSPSTGGESGAGGAASDSSGLVSPA